MNEVNACMNTLKKVEKSVTLDVTSRCNLTCKHCYNSFKYLGTNIEMKLAEIEALFNYLEKRGYGYVNLLGGEPFLREDILSIIDLATSSNLRLNITTNGIWNSLETVKTALSANVVKAVNVSLDGTNSVTADEIRGVGVFETVKRNLSLLKPQEKRKIRLSFVVTDSNMHQLPDIPVLCESMGISSFTVTPLYKAGGGDALSMNYSNCIARMLQLAKSLQSEYSHIEALCEFRPLLVNLLKLKYPKCGIEDASLNSLCRAGDREFYIEADGTVRICHIDDDRLTRSSIQTKKESIRYHINDIVANDIDIFSISSYKDFCKVKYSQYQKRLIPCKECEYSFTCFPCPAYYSNRESVGMCVEVKTHLDKEIASILRSIPILNSTGTYSDFGEVASSMFSLIKGKQSVTEIVDKLLNEYDVSRSELSSDICAFIMSCKFEGILSLRDSEAP